MGATDPIAAGVQAGAQVSSASDYGDRLKHAGADLLGGAGGGVIAGGAAESALASSTLSAALPFLSAAAPVAAVLLPVAAFIYGLDQAIVTLFGIDPATCYSITFPQVALASWGCQDTAYYFRWYPSSGGESFVKPNDYANNYSRALNWAKNTPEVAVRQGCNQFADNSGILPQQAVTPDGTLIPGADTILQPLQAYAAAAVMSAYPTMLPIWRITIGATFPALTDYLKNKIIQAVQPLHDAHVALAQTWANAQTTRPTVSILQDRFGLLPVDAQPIVDSWKVGGHMHVPGFPNGSGETSGGEAHPGTATSPAKVAVVSTAGVVGVAGIIVLFHALSSGVSFVSSAHSIYGYAKRFFTKKPKAKRKR